MFDRSCLSLLWKHASFFQHLLLNICIMTSIRSYYAHPLTDSFCCWNFEEAMEKREESFSEESPKEGVLQRNHQKKECFKGITKGRSPSEESPKEGVLQRNHQKKECFRGVTKRREETKNFGAEGSDLHVTFSHSQKILRKTFVVGSIFSKTVESKATVLYSSSRCYLKFSEHIMCKKLSGLLPKFLDNFFTGYVA